MGDHNAEVTGPFNRDADAVEGGSEAASNSGNLRQPRHFLTQRRKEERGRWTVMQGRRLVLSDRALWGRNCGEGGRRKNTRLPGRSVLCAFAALRANLSWFGVVRSRRLDPRPCLRGGRLCAGMALDICVLWARVPWPRAAVSYDMFAGPMHSAHGRTRPWHTEVAGWCWRSERRGLPWAGHRRVDRMRGRLRSRPERRERLGVQVGFAAFLGDGGEQDGGGDAGFGGVGF